MRIDIAIMSEQHWPETIKTRHLTQRGVQTDRCVWITQMCTKYCIFHWLAVFFLSLFLSLQLSIAMTCKSVKDYKYSIASFQSATEISVNNLLKQTKFSFLFLFLLVNVVGFGFFLPLFVWHSVELSLVRSKHNIKYYLKLWYNKALKFKKRGKFYVYYKIYK